MRTLVVLALVVACGGDKQDAPVAGSSAPANPDDEVVERAIQSISAISDLAARHKTNCDALAKDLVAHAQRNAPLIAAFKKVMADPTKQQALTARFGERIQQVGQASVASLRDHCAAHPAVAGVLKKLE